MHHNYIIHVHTNHTGMLIHYILCNEKAKSIQIDVAKNGMDIISIASTFGYVSFVTFISDLNVTLTINKYNSEWLTTPREALNDYTQNYPDNVIPFKDVWETGDDARYDRMMKCYDGDIETEEDYNDLMDLYKDYSGL